MIYFFSPYYKNYESTFSYAVYILNEENEQYNIFIISKDESIQERKIEKKTINIMIKDKLLIKEDPKLLNIEKVIAKFFLKKGDINEY